MTDPTTHHADAILRAAEPAAFMYERKPDAWPSDCKPVLTLTAFPHDDPARPFWTEQPLYTAEAILSAVREAMEAKWLPIEQATKDGSSILACWADMGGSPEVVYWDEHCGEWTVMGFAVQTPTHYQPLPAPPRGE